MLKRTLLLSTNLRNLIHKPDASKNFHSYYALSVSHKYPIKAINRKKENLKKVSKKTENSNQYLEVYKYLSSLEIQDALYSLNVNKRQDVWEAKLQIQWPENRELCSFSSSKSEATEDCLNQLGVVLNKHELFKQGRPNWLKIFSSFNDIRCDSNPMAVKNKFIKIFQSSGISKPKSIFLHHGQFWKCTIYLSEPIMKAVTGFGNNKIESEAVAMIQIINFLQCNDYMDKNGYIKQYSTEESDKLKVLWDSGYNVSINDSIISEIKSLDSEFKDFKEKLSNQVELNNDSEMNEDMYDQINIMTGRPLSINTGKNKAKFNGLHADEGCKIPPSGNLPIYKSKSEILETIKKNQVTVICGGTGCGKSTQVPQFILDHCRDDCNVVVTQPRRISAISLAERVAYERGEKVGTTVGYQVRLEGIKPPSVNGILFCTVGILLRRMQLAPMMTGISHVIVDEVHERGVDIDFLLIVLKNLLKQRPDFKVILMSASVNSEKFSWYFNNAPVVNVEGRTYPVQNYYLDEALNFISHSLRKYYPSDLHRQIESKAINVDLITDLILSIDKSTPSSGSILCFLPGWQEIKTLQNELSRFLNIFFVVPLHSLLSPSEQRRAFEIPPTGQRKVVLSTNIAETSVTIEDVVYVIDTGLHKEKRFNTEKGTATLDLHWISQANVLQRKGRAGRVQPGICYALYTEDQYSDFVKFPIPEIHRIPLEKVVLDAKSLYTNVSAEKFLSQTIEPPSLRAIHHAVQELKDLDILSENEQLTEIGNVVSNFSTHPRLSRALVYGWFLKCINPVLTSVAMLSADKDPFVSRLENRTMVRKVKRSFHETSDHLSFVNLMGEWRYQPEQKEFCFENNLNNRSMWNINGIKKIIAEELVMSELYSSVKEIFRDNGEYVVDDVVISCLCAGLSAGSKPHVVWTRRGSFWKGKIDWDDCKLMTNNGGAVGFYSDAVIKSPDDIPRRFDLLIYFHGIYSKERRLFMLRESSCAPNIAFVLFGGKDAKVEKSGDGSVIVFNSLKNAKFACDNSSAEALLQFRGILRDTLNYTLLSKTSVVDNVKKRFIGEFAAKVVGVFYKLLSRTPDSTQMESLRQR